MRFRVALGAFCGNGVLVVRGGLLVVFAPAGIVFVGNDFEKTRKTENAFGFVGDFFQHVFRACETPLRLARREQRVRIFRAFLRGKIFVFRRERIFGQRLIFGNDFPVRERRSLIAETLDPAGAQKQALIRIPDASFLHLRHVRKHQPRTRSRERNVEKGGGIFAFRFEKRAEKFVRLVFRFFRGKKQRGNAVLRFAFDEFALRRSERARPERRHENDIKLQAFAFVHGEHAHGGAIASRAQLQRVGLVRGIGVCDFFFKNFGERARRNSASAFLGVENFGKVAHVGHELFRIGAFGKRSEKSERAGKPTKRGKKSLAFPLRVRFKKGLADALFVRRIIVPEQNFFSGVAEKRREQRATETRRVLRLEHGANDVRERERNRLAKHVPARRGRNRNAALREQLAVKIRFVVFGNEHRDALRGNAAFADKRANIIDNAFGDMLHAALFAAFFLENAEHGGGNVAIFGGKRVRALRRERDGRVFEKPAEFRFKLARSFVCARIEFVGDFRVAGKNLVERVDHRGRGAPVFFEH